jgi:hypothetical protein
MTKVEDEIMKRDGLEFKIRMRVDWYIIWGMSFSMSMCFEPPPLPLLPLLLSHPSQHKTSHLPFESGE